MTSVCLAAAVAFLLCGQIASASASVISVTAPTSASATVAPSATVALNGASISDSLGGSDQLLVTVSAGSGTVSFTQTSGLTLATGYNSFTSVPTVAFQGSVTNINAALASLKYTAPAQTTGDSVSITATSLADAGGNTIAYLPSTGHFYEYVPDASVTWYTAQTNANTTYFDGAQGYLATIPNPTVSSFIEQHLAAHDVWAGGESFDYPSGYMGNSSVQRVWIWADDANQFPTDNAFTPDSAYYGGPLAGEIFTECAVAANSCVFTNQSAWNGAVDDASSWVESAWNPGEPNNSSYNAGNPAGPTNGEHYIELNTGGGVDWNDLSATNNGISGYVVEFGNAWGSPSSFPSGQGTGSANLVVANVPAAPTGVTVDPVSSAGGQAKVSWTASASNGGSAITGYKVTAMPGGETCSTTGTSCTVSGLSDGASYTFAVVAVNAAGDSPADTSASASVSGAPHAPTGLSAISMTTSGGQVTLSWDVPDDGGSPITGYTVTVSPGGGSCTTTSTSCVFSGLTDGEAYSFVVTATNALGTSAASAPLTVKPSSPQVSVPSQNVSAGVNLTPQGGVSVPLTCAGPDPCDVSVGFTIERSALTPGAGGVETVADATGVEISASGTGDVNVKLSPEILRGLQARGVRSVTVTVAITTSAGAVSTEQVALQIPEGLDVCPVSTGRISGMTLGPVTLGETKAAFEGRYPRHERQRYGFARFCFAASTGFRVEYLTPAVLSASKQASLRGRVVVAVTANRDYSIDGVHPGTKLTSVRSRLHLGPGVQGGKNRWYVLPGKAANGVLKVRDGVIEGIGIAVKQLTSTMAEQKVLFDQAALRG